MTPFIMTITGPSCAGKSTLERMLKERGFENAISTTTRTMREGEKDGVNYYYTDKMQFEFLDRSGYFIESIVFNGNNYGLSSAEVSRLSSMGKPVVVVCEPSGRDQIRKFCMNRGWECRSVFVGNPPEVIMSRFMNRFAEEVSFMTPDEKDKAVRTYSSRLVEMITTEKAWTEEGVVRSPYSFVFPWFDETNSSCVVDTLAETARASQILKNPYNAGLVLTAAR